MYLPGAFQVMVAAVKDEPKVTQAFRNGAGVPWHEHDPDLFAGTERFFRPGYAANLVSSWIPALDGVQAKLEAGALVADVGCGHGASTLIMAQAYPNSTFVGFDYHQPSVQHAQQVAANAGLAERCHFEVATAW
jgi:tRNA G46 methylase TrmB